MYKNMEMDEFYKRQKSGELSVLDVRERHEYEQGHIPSAENIPLSEIEDHVQKLDQQKEYSVICRSGKRSEKASAFLSKKGFDVTNVCGGMLEWERKAEEDAGK